MAETKRYCSRCGKQGVRVQHPTDEVWNCPQKHGEIFRAPLKSLELEAPPQMAVAKKRVK